MRLSVSRKNICLILVGSAVQAFGIYNIHSVSGVTEGGEIGLMLLLFHWFSISPAVSSMVMDVALYALGWRTLGKDFLIYSGIACGSFSLFYALLERFPRLWPELSAHPFFAALFGAVFIGIGVGLCVRGGGAPAGDDALAMILTHRFGWSMQRIYLVSDVVVLALSLTYIPLQRIAWSLFSVVLSGQIIGWVQKSKRPEEAA